MSIGSFQKDVLAGAREVLRNPALHLRQLIEWNKEEHIVRDSCRAHEVVVFVPNPGVWVCVLAKNDHSVRRATNSRTATTIQQKENNYEPTNSGNCGSPNEVLRRTAHHAQAARG